MTLYIRLLLINKKFTIGAHSEDHPLFSELSMSDQKNQVIKSLKKLNEMFGISDLYFSFPFTDDKLSVELFEKINSEPGIQLRASFGTAGIKKDLYSNHYQRIPMEVGKYSASQILSAEFIYYLMKIPFGKNKIIRR